MKQAIILAHKLINTMESASFSKGLTQLWVGVTKCNNAFEIQSTSCSAIASKLASFTRRHTFSELRDYLDHFAAVKGVKILKAQQKGLINAMSMEDYVVLRDFIYSESAKYRPVGSLSGKQFEFHELVWEMADYFLVKDAVEHGTGIPALDRMIESLLFTKPAQFFKSGFIKDLFIIDRLNIIEHAENVAYIRTHNDYLSTQVLNHDEAATQRDAAFTYFKVA